MSEVTLYGDIISPCVRAVLLTAKALGVSLKFVNVDLLKGEQKLEDFQKLNPKGVVPTLVDDDLVLWDSHAIMIYLVEKYGKSSDLYPQDVKKRALVNRMLFFDGCDVFPWHLFIGKFVLNHQSGKISLPETALEYLKTSFDLLEGIRGQCTYNLYLGCGGTYRPRGILAKNKYVAGSTVTIADFSLWTTVCNAGVWFPKEKFPNITAWCENMKKLPYADENLIGAKEFRDKFAPFLQKIDF